MISISMITVVIMIMIMIMIVILEHHACGWSGRASESSMRRELYSASSTFSVRCEELPEQRRDVREMLALERPSRQIPGLQHIGSECTVGTRVGATVGRGGGGGGGAEGLQHDRGAVALLCVRDAACPISTG